MDAAASPRVLPCGDTALAVEFGGEIDPATNARVLALDARVSRGVPGVIETVPTYRSLLVHYDPVATDFDALGAALTALSADLPETPAEGGSGAFRSSMAARSGSTSTTSPRDTASTPADLIARHAAPVYRVYMIGFMPGFAYLGGLDPSIATPRRETPRAKTPAGTISIGGVQAAVASIEAPSGWRLLGRTPVRTFMLGRDPPFILGPGDRVTFDPTPAAHWDALDRAAAAGDLVAELAR